MNEMIFCGWRNIRFHKISDCVLPSDLSEPFSEFVEQGKVPNLILTGGPFHW